MAISKMVKIYAVIPCYNEDQNLSVVTEMFIPLWEKNNVTVLYVDDGSTDKTWEVLKGLSAEYECVECAQLSRNFGKEKALLAGISMLPENAGIVVLDADGQHTPEATGKILDTLINSECDIAYGIRSSREYQSFAHRLFSKSFYQVLNAFLDRKVDPRIGDFFAATPDVVSVLRRFSDNNLFFKGIYSYIGFKTKMVEVSIPDRFHGESKFNFKSRLKLAIAGITSMSSRPLAMISWLGIIIFFASCFGALYVIFEALILRSGNRTGYYTIVLLQFAVSGLTLMSLGVVARYLATIFQNTSSRPIFIVKNEASVRSRLDAVNVKK